MEEQQAAKEEQEAGREDIDQAPETQLLFSTNRTMDEKSENCSPWMSEKTSTISDPLVRMHNQTIDFCLYLSPTPEEHEANLAAYKQIKESVISQIEGATVTAPLLVNHLYLTQTQPEILILVPGSQLESAFGSLKTILHQLSYIDEQLSPSAHQKYDIYTVLAQRGTFKLQVRLLDLKWKAFIRHLEEDIYSYVEIKYMYFVLECIVRQRTMHHQIKPCLLLGLLSIFMYERRKQKVRTLTENIIKFFEYFGVGTFYEKKIIFTDRGSYEIKQQNSQVVFSFWISEDIEISCPLMRDFFNLLRNRYRIISNYNFRDNQSILTWLVNPVRAKFSYL